MPSRSRTPRQQIYCTVRQRDGAAYELGVYARYTSIVEACIIGRKKKIIIKKESPAIQRHISATESYLKIIAHQRDSGLPARTRFPVLDYG